MLKIIIYMSNLKKLFYFNNIDNINYHKTDRINLPSINNIDNNKIIKTNPTFLTPKDEMIHTNNTNYKKYIRQNSITDTQGLNRAYKNGDTYVFGDTMYIAGSHNLRDWYDDITKIPFYGDTRNAARYKAAEKVLLDNPNIKNLVSHSLGSSVSLELQKQYKDRNLNTRTYGAPVWDPLGLDKVAYEQYIKLGKPDFIPEPNKVERYRNITDPVSFFDASATKSIKLNPFNNMSLTHSFDNIGNAKTTTETETFYIPEQPKDEESQVLTE